ncbi:hypothetical protein AADZ86_06695 [Colwelliaceae bacterium BS250]
MKPVLNSLSEIVAQANDNFYNNHKSINIIMGIMDKNLRKQGMNADAITIDCVAKNKKIVFLLHDSKPTKVDVALGNKEGDISSSAEYDLASMTVASVEAIFATTFLS